MSPAAVCYTNRVHRTALVGALLLVVCLTHTVHADTATTTPDAPSTATTTKISIDSLNSDDVEAKVRQDFADAPVMIKIAKCESNFRQFDEFGNPLFGGTGGMVGVFQEAAAVHGDAATSLGFNINTLDGNLGYARYLYETQGTAPWLGSGACWNPPRITSALQVGSKGVQVKVLQQLLNSNGYAIAQEGDGSPGHETGLFGAMTKEAVERFQCDQHIVCAGSEKTTGYGMVGGKTRLALAHLDAETAQANSTTTLSRI